MAQTAADEFHRRLGDKEDEQILANAAPEFRNAIGTEPAALFARIRTKLGIPHDSRPMNVQARHMQSGNFIIGRFITKFDEGDAQENFMWRIQNGNLYLVKYSIESSLMTD